MAVALLTRIRVASSVLQQEDSEGFIAVKRSVVGSNDLKICMRG